MVQLPENEGPIPVVLVGNKCDIEKGDGQVDQSYLNKYCDGKFLEQNYPKDFGADNVTILNTCILVAIFAYEKKTTCLRHGLILLLIPVRASRNQLGV